MAPLLHYQDDDNTDNADDDGDDDNTENDDVDDDNYIVSIHCRVEICITNILLGFTSPYHKNSVLEIRIAIAIPEKRYLIILYIPRILRGPGVQCSP